MRIFLDILLYGLMTMMCIFLCSDVQCQTSDTARTIHFPLTNEDFSLFDFAEVRFETDKTEKPPADLVKRNFQPVKEIFQKDSLHFNDSVHSVWIKIQITNNLQQIHLSH
jgi:hypothetical protein